MGCDDYYDPHTERRDRERRERTQELQRQGFRCWVETGIFGPNVTACVCLGCRLQVGLSDEDRAVHSAHCELLKAHLSAVPAE